MDKYLIGKTEAEYIQIITNLRKALEYRSMTEIITQQKLRAVEEYAKDLMKADKKRKFVYTTDGINLNDLIGKVD